MFRRILVPVDGGPTSSQGLEAAMALARRLCLLHVVDEFVVSLRLGGATYAPARNALPVLLVRSPRRRRS